MHYANDLIRLFNATFQDSHNTILVGGSEEPLYRPADEDHPHHRILFTRDYFASALHEVAHWCIAGYRRRQRVDYGYWYQPDGRDRQRQREFERVEARPQAIERVFSEACGSPFRVSLDNLDGDPADPERFREKVEAAYQRLCREGLPPRAEHFRQVLGKAYQKASRALQGVTVRGVSV